MLECGAFAQSDEEARFALAEISRVLELQDGEVFIEEGKRGTQVFFVLGGEAEVFSRSPDDGHDHHIAWLPPGEVVGELSLLDSEPRSASVRARGPSTVLAIPIDSFGDLATRLVGVTQVQLALTQGAVARFREATTRATRAMRREREEALCRAREAEVRASMGSFIVKLLLGVTLYMYMLGVASFAIDYVPSATLVGVPILLIFALLVGRIIRGSALPPEAYGLTLAKAHEEAFAGFLWSLPILGVMLFAKALMIATLPGGDEEVLFDLGRHHQHLSTAMFLTMAVAYSVLAPIQEFVARSGVQAPLTEYLAGPKARRTAILLAGLLFSATHLHVSAPLALLVFPLGVYWGYLFDRRRTLVSVAVSHVLVGNIGFLVIGFDGFLR